MGNLGKRIITAVVLIPGVVAAILLLSWQWVGLIFAVVIAAAAWEWTALAGWASRPLVRAAYIGVTLGALACGYVLPQVVGHGVMVVGVVWWALAFSAVVAYQRNWAIPTHWPGFVWALFGWLTLVPAWFSVVAAHRIGEHGPGLVLIMMVIIWMADIGAYFAGRSFGKCKLASRVSPGKSWEGAVGGLVAALSAAIVYVVFVRSDATASFLALALLVIVVSVFGDLTESLFKRISGNKDSGSLLPGHGGVLDRIDSLTAAAPVFALGLLLIEGAL